MFQVDLLAAESLAGFGLITLITLSAAPGRELRDKEQQRSWILLVLGTVVAYLSTSPWLFLSGWILTTVPFLLDRNRYGTGTAWIHAASSLLLALGIGLGTAQPGLAFAMLAGAILLRKGIFPFHFWVPAAFEKGSLPLLNLFLNGHLGAYLMIRYAVPLHPATAAQSLSLLGTLAIFTSLYGAILAVATARPRRILALLCTSQAAFILAGLENRNVEGITGALLHWWVVALATTGMLAVCAALEARTTEVLSPRGFLGLGYHAPRLAVFFTVSALALVGLPGTLGFAAEDLLFHGALESHPLLGIGLPLATALNAVTALRLVSTLFLGRRGIHVPAIPDVMSRERFGLLLAVIVLVAGGIGPAYLIALRTGSAEWIAGLLGGH